MIIPIVLKILLVVLQHANSTCKSACFWVVSHSVQLGVSWYLKRTKKYCTKKELFLGWRMSQVHSIQSWKKRSSMMCVAVVIYFLISTHHFHFGLCSSFCHYVNWNCVPFFQHLFCKWTNNIDPNQNQIKSNKRFAEHTSLNFVVCPFWLLTPSILNIDRSRSTYLSI